MPRYLFVQSLGGSPAVSPVWNNYEKIEVTFGIRNASRNRSEHEDTKRLHETHDLVNDSLLIIC